MRIIQANLQHSRAASAALSNDVLKESLDIALLQEPWINGKNIMGLNSAGKICYNVDGIRPRACIIFRNNINFLPIPGLCTDDLVAAYVSLQHEEGTKLIVCSAYLPGDEQDPSQRLAPVIEYSKQQRAQIIMGCDSNSHHTSWGSSNTNSRGEYLSDFLLTNNLTTLNRGCLPTFVTRAREEVLDITISSELISNRIREWHVSSNASMSDHRHIRFNVGQNKMARKESYRNPKSTNWENYRAQLVPALDAINNSVKTLEQLENTVEAVGTELTAAYLENCPLKIKKSNRNVPWWNSELDKLRRDARSLFNKAKKTNSWEPYKRALTEFNRELRKAKRQSWRKFCEEINSTSHLSKIHKIVSKSPQNHLGLLRKPDGKFTESVEETLELMASVHFPGSVLLKNSECSQTGIIGEGKPTSEDWRRASQIFRPHQIKWAINSFQPYKTSGEDGIFPALLQKCLDNILPILVKIFRASYAWGYIPKKWSKTRVTYIPKTGDKDKS